MLRFFKRFALGLVFLIAVTAIALAVWEPLIAEEVSAPAARKYDVETPGKKVQFWLGIVNLTPAK